MHLFNHAIEAISRFLADQKQNFILWPPVFVSIGIAWYFGLSNEPQLTNVVLYFGIPLIISMLAWIGITRHLLTSRLQLFLASFLIIYGLISLGFITSYLRTNILNTNMITKDMPPQIIEGVITHTDHNQTSKTNIYTLSVLSIDGISNKVNQPQSVRISSRLKNVNLESGMKIRALISLQPIQKPISDTAYDFRRHYYFQNISGMGFLLKPPEILKNSTQTYETTLISWREALRLKIESILNARTAGIVTALMTGERAQIDDTDWDHLRASGLAHIISISGLHVAMVATSIFFVVRLILALVPILALQFPIKKIAAFAALLGCILYVGFVVPTVPTTRALLMTGVALVAILLDRSPFSLRLVSLSALAILLVLPESLWSASFQLSFAAVTLLVVFAEMTRDYWNKWRRDAGFVHKILLFVLSSIFTTIIASIATAPYSSFHFGQIANYSVIANGLSIPLAGLIIMPMLIISFLALPFNLEFYPLKIMGWGVDRMLDIAAFTSQLPHAVTLTPTWPFAALILITTSFIIFAFIMGPWRWVSIVPLIIAFLIISMNQIGYVFIAPDHKMIMIRDDQNNIYVSSARKHKYAREEWMQSLGLSPDHMFTAFPKEGLLQKGKVNISCDRGACRIVTPNQQKISFGIDQKSLFEDCAWADIIITEKYFTPHKGTCPARIKDRQYIKTRNSNRPWEFLEKF